MRRRYDGACPQSVQDGATGNEGLTHRRLALRDTAIAGQTPVWWELVAQSVEHVTFTHGVMGSNPIELTKKPSYSLKPGKLRCRGDWRQCAVCGELVRCAEHVSAHIIAERVSGIRPEIVRVEPR